VGKKHHPFANVVVLRIAIGRARKPIGHGINRNVLRRGAGHLQAHLQAQEQLENAKAEADAEVQSKQRDVENSKADVRHYALRRSQHLQSIT